VIVVDGESTDGTQRVLADLRDKIDILIVEKDSGQSEALNRGFKCATGDWFAWLCADDELTPNALKDLERVIKLSPQADVIVGACQRCIEKGPSLVVVPPENLAVLLSYKNPIDQPSTFWTRKIHEKAGAIDESLHYAMDWDCWCRFRSAGAAFVTTPKVLSRYHFNGLNKTSRNPEGNLRETLEIVRRYAGLDGAVAKIYNHIFETYDKFGCLDNPPTGDPGRYSDWQCARRAIARVFGNEVVDNYNLNWVSKQMRGLSIH
jgi:glycosyltransferase involved in cell wall biosynthesis